MIRINPLHWKRRKNGDYFSDCIIGRYEVGKIDGRFICMLRTVTGNESEDIRIGYRTKAFSAKFAAYEDFCERILSVVHSHD